MPQPDRSLRLLKVLVLPEAMRGSNEGHYPWDLAPGSMMTNATIVDVGSSAGGTARITLKYKDGEQSIVVAADVPIVTFEPGGRSMIVVGRTC